MGILSPRFLVVFGNLEDGVEIVGGVGFVFLLVSAFFAMVSNDVFCLFVLNLDGFH